MNLREKTYNYDTFKKGGTGIHEVSKNYNTIIYPFDKYLITIQVTPNNEFIGITEIKINKDFLSYTGCPTNKL